MRLGPPVATHRPVIDGHSNPDTSGYRKLVTDISDFRFAASSLALILIAYPAVSSLAPSVADAAYVGLLILLIPLVIHRLSWVRMPAVCILVLVVLYASSSLFTESYIEGFAERGLRNTVTLAFIGTAFLTFAAYGSTLFSLSWFPSAALAVVSIDIIVIVASGFSKNKTSAAILYVSALAVMCVIYRSRSSGWIAAIGFAALCASLALWFDARFMIGCSAVFFIMFIAASRFSAKVYWVLGLVVALIVVPLVIWFFLNVERGGLARQLGQSIAEMSGRRANSGRDVLFPYLLEATQESPVVGLGAGTLPRNIISTGFSAHNYYIQLYLQLGILGLAVLVTFLLTVWTLLARGRSAAGKFGSALFIMFTVHNATEVIMFQNAAVMAVPAWCAVGLAYAITQQESDRDRFFGSSPMQPKNSAVAHEQRVQTSGANGPVG